MKIQEALDLLDRQEKFLMAYGVKVLQSLHDGFPVLEQELIGFLKGKSFVIPLETVQRAVAGAERPDEGFQRCRKVLFDRHHLLQELLQRLIPEIGREVACRPLVEMVEHGEPAEKALSLIVLACLSHGKARELLRESFETFSRPYRWALMAILEKDGDMEWPALFLLGLEDSEPEIARLAVQGLGKTGLAAFGKKLLPLLEKKNEALLVATVQALGRLKAPEALPHLLELAQKSKNERLRATALSTLGEFPETESIPLLARHLEHRNPRVRANAALALRRKYEQFGRLDEDIITKLKDLLFDADHRVRADTVQCLWEMGRIESLDYIRAMIADDDAGIRASGAYLCGKLKSLQLKDDLAELTADSSYQVRKTSAISLLGLGEPGKTLIESLFDRGTPDQQVCAALALSLANDRRGLEHLFSISQTEGEFSQLATELLLSTT